MKIYSQLLPVWLSLYQALFSNLLVLSLSLEQSTIILWIKAIPLEPLHVYFTFQAAITLVCYQIAL